jgi:hypothetical protein
MILKNLMTTNSYQELTQKVIFLIRNDKYKDVSSQIASTLRYYSEHDNDLANNLQKADDILCNFGEWEDAKTSISPLIKSLFDDCKINPIIKIKGLPYDIVWHSTEEYLRWND